MGSQRTERRGLRREEQEVGRGLSETLRTIQAFPQLTAEAPLGADQAAQEQQLRRKISTASFFQRQARPKGTFEDFFASRLGGLREQFGQSPAGLQEEQRLTRLGEIEEEEAERNRRGLLRGGRTTFERQLGG